MKRLPSNKNETKAKVVARLRHLNQRFSQTELAELIGCSQGSISGWMLGNNLPHQMWVKRIMEIKP